MALTGFLARHHRTAAWLLLLGLTLVGTWIGETEASGVAVTLFVAVTIGVKSRLVMNHFLELPDAVPGIRFAVRLFFIGMPVLVIVTWLWGDVIARITGAAVG
jgi:hypothetical protein